LMHHFTTEVSPEIKLLQFKDTDMATSKNV
jgi:hypothetical protein